MDDTQLRALMMESVREAQCSRPEDNEPRPRVGAVLSDARGCILAKAHRGERGLGEHAEFILLEKARDMGIDLSKATLFTTLEPCVMRGLNKIPCHQRIIDSGIQTVYIGMLDPNPGILGRGEQSLRHRGVRVERYPDEVIRQLEDLNLDFMDLHKESILPDTSIYVARQISSYIADTLRENGINVKDIPSDWDVTATDLERYCDAHCDPRSTSRLADIIRQARGEAYDRKYSDYTYDQDVRGLNSLWREELRALLRDLGESDYANKRIINIGIGNGLEAEGMFDAVEQITLVDIAPISLSKAKALVPRAIAFTNAAEDLHDIDANSHDIYVSLRTYQSTYFDVPRATREACRVLRPKGLAVISVSNGFVGRGNAVVNGLVIPGTKVVNRQRPYEIADKIRRSLTSLPFDHVGLRTGVAEIFVFGRKSA